ncbi:hypothetical protein B0H13DRAFT_2303400 [Mycena leptocephala]|nr:hypothetical protein B0H13DRAFT_2303400 [Mycena leptocephala]
MPSPLHSLRPRFPLHLPFPPERALPTLSPHYHDSRPRGETRGALAATPFHAALLYSPSKCLVGQTLLSRIHAVGRHLLDCHTPPLLKQTQTPIQRQLDLYPPFPTVHHIIPFSLSPRFFGSAHQSLSSEAPVDLGIFGSTAPNLHTLTTGLSKDSTAHSLATTANLHCKPPQAPTTRHHQK